MDKTAEFYKEFTDNRQACTDERLSVIEFGIDILSSLGDKILRFADRTNPSVPISQWTDDPDFRHVLLRAVGQSNTDAAERIRVILLYSDTTDRYHLESVLEALGDVGTREAHREIERFTSNSDPFIAELAKELASE